MQILKATAVNNDGWSVYLYAKDALECIGALRDRFNISEWSIAPAALPEEYKARVLYVEPIGCLMCQMKLSHVHPQA